MLAALVLGDELRARAHNDVIIICHNIITHSCYVVSMLMYRGKGEWDSIRYCGEKARGILRAIGV